MAVTSLGIHSLWQRKTAESQRAQIGGQISILDSMLQRLRAEEAIPEREFDKLWKLARSHEEDNLSSVQQAGVQETIGWKDVLLGRKNVRSASTEEWDKRDLDRGALPVQPCFLGSKLSLHC